MAELPAGTEVAGCRVVAVLGRGGMGVVYRAEQLSLERVVALKVIVPDLAMDEEFRERFKHEARLAASIEHPNVIPVYEAGERDGLLYLIMRYIEGTDLRALIDKEGGLEPRRAARLVAQVAAALEAAHRRGLVHRDVKPANVLIASASEGGHAYLTDFGIARQLAATKGLTRTGALVGTLDYIAPERLEHPAGDARSDVYALGCVLYEALTGSVPYPRDSEPAKMFAHVSAPVPSPREVRGEVPEELDDLVRRSMAKDPDDRPARADELAEALVAFASAAPGRPGGDTTRAHPSAAPTVPLPAEDAPARSSAPTEPAPTEPLPPAGPTEPAAPEPAAPAGPTEPVPTEPAAPAGPAEPAPPTTPAEPVPAEPAPPTAPAEPVPPRQAAPPRRPEPAPRSQQRVPRAAILGGLGLVALIGIAVLLLSGGGSDGGGDDSGGIADRKAAGPLSPKALAPIELSPGADGVAVGEGFVWVADKDDNVVTRVDPNSREEQGETPVGREPDSIAIGEGSVWVTNSSSNDVSRIDPRSAKVVEKHPVGRGPEGIAVGKGAVWVANQDDGTVTRTDAGSGASRASPVGSKPIQLAIATDAVWVTVSGDETIVPLDPDTGETAASPVKIGGEPRGIAFAGGLLWVSATKANRIVVVDPKSRKVIGRIEVADNPREVRAGEGAVWVTNAEASEVTAIDPASRSVAGSAKVKGKPFGLGVGAGLVWAASLDNGLLTPIRPDGG